MFADSICMCLVWKDLIIHSVCPFNVFWPWLHKVLGGFLSSLYFNKILLSDLNMLDTALDSGYTDINKTCSVHLRSSYFLEDRQHGKE